MSGQKFTINTIQRTAFVKRLAIQRYNGFSVDNIIPYDYDNLYPNKCRSIAQRSGSLTTAIGTLSRFLVGQGFTNYNDLTINDEGDTLLDLLRATAEEYAHFGIAWHIKYNIFGHVAEVCPLLFEQVRIERPANGEDCEKYVIRADWSEPMINAGLRCTAFDPDDVLEEFEKCGGWQNHPGQVLYFHGSKEIYPLAKFDSVLDDAQLEAEAKIFALSNIQNGFAGGGVLKYPKTLNTDTEQQEARSQIKELLEGSRNAGTTIAIGLQPGQMEKDIKMWEPFEIPNIDSYYKVLREDAKKNIYELFQQPGIINGRSDSGMFNEASMRDAFAFYNSVTESQRQDIAKVFEWVFAPLKFEIKPLDFIVNTQVQTITQV